MNTVLFSGNVDGTPTTRSAGKGTAIQVKVRAVMNRYTDRSGEEHVKYGSVQFETYEREDTPTEIGNAIKRLTPGEFVVVEGHLDVVEYEKNGEPRSFTKITVDKIVNKVMPSEHRPDGSVANPPSQGTMESDVPF